MSPYEIDVLCWYHCRAIDHDDMSRNPPVWRPTIEKFKNLELLEDDPTNKRCYRLTSRGEFYVTEGICNVPLPERTGWAIPNRPDR